LDERDDGGNRRSLGKLLGGIVKESKMPEEKAVRRFGLGTRKMLVSGTVNSRVEERDEQEAGTGAVHTRCWNRRRCAASFHSQLDTASISTELRATTSCWRRNMMDQIFGDEVRCQRGE
jgi:hypothetical protein